MPGSFNADSNALLPYASFGVDHHRMAPNYDASAPLNYKPHTPRAPNTFTSFNDGKGL